MRLYRRFPKSKAGLFAREIAARLMALRDECGGGDVYDPATWLRVAERLGCIVEPRFDPYGPSGHYTPSPSFEGLGIIEYNTARSLLQQALILIHELGHHLLWPHEQGMLFGVELREGYDDDGRSVRHLIARMVERRIAGRRRIRD